MRAACIQDLGAEARGVGEGSRGEQQAVEQRVPAGGDLAPTARTDHAIGPTPAAAVCEVQN